MTRRTTANARRHARRGEQRTRNRASKHNLSNVHEYRVWQTMRLRCIDPKNAAYANYGGRGITICDQWRDDPAQFIADVGHRPSNKHEIDRIDNDRGYEPGNVRWVTRTQNSRNRRSNRWIEFGGERKTVAEWAEITGIHGDVIRYRLNTGWSLHRTMTTPVRSKQSVRQGTKSRTP